VAFRQSVARAEAKKSFLRLGGTSLREALKAAVRWHSVHERIPWFLLKAVTGLVVLEHVGGYNEFPRPGSKKRKSRANSRSEHPHTFWDSTGQGRRLNPREVLN
jgi:hypothetical protein